MAFSLGRAVWMGIYAVKQVKAGLPAPSQRFDTSIDIKGRVKTILANSFRLDGEVVISATHQQLGELGINIDDLENTIPSSKVKLENEDVQRLAMIKSLIGACDWMREAADAIDQGRVNAWVKNCPYQVPKGLQIMNFTLCDKDLPETEKALKQVIYMSLCKLDKDGFGDIRWRVISNNPCIRGMCGIEVTANKL